MTIDWFNVYGDGVICTVIIHIFWVITHRDYLNTFANDHGVHIAWAGGIIAFILTTFLCPLTLVVYVANKFREESKP